ncbi:MAG: HAD family phosphatase [Lachnospiraceae bacterium]|nr:HAD family phosphatase [Lachnospiraceae bacterium]
MKYKILALDIDGTLTNSKKEVTDEVKEKINGLYQKNIPVLLVSGRPTEGILPIADEIKLRENNGYILAFNGGKIIKADTGEVIYSKSIPNEPIHDICQFAKDNNLAILTYKDGKIITNNPEDEYVRIEARINKLEAVRVGDMEGEAPQSPDKFLIVGNPKILENKVEEMAELFKGKLNIFRSEPYFIEIVPMGIDKAESLEILLNKLSLKREELIACGDGRNDITMIDYAGMGVAMENACDEAKSVANFITKSNDENGVAAAIDKFF